MSEIQVTDLSPILIREGIIIKPMNAVMIDNLFSPSECEKLLEKAEKKGFEAALLNVGFGKQSLRTDIRKSERCIIDDVEMAGMFWEKIKDFVPHEIEDHEVVGVNERLRFLKYSKGDYFKPHFDGSYVRPDGSEISLVTFFLFLNDGYKGGESTFMHPGNNKITFPCVPKKGRLILFEHHIYHEGSQLKSGHKYALRTDIMYGKKK